MPDTQVQSQLQSQVREPRQEANRYYTPVSVEIYVNSRLLRIKWFSDLQLAYLYCMNQKEMARDNDWQTPYTNFPAFADQMDYLWARRAERTSSSLCALYIEEPEFVEYWLTYEPDSRA